MLRFEERSAPRVPVATSVSLVLLFSALAFHLLFFRRAKRDLGF
jgi:hypothetical protein